VASVKKLIAGDLVTIVNRHGYELFGLYYLQYTDRGLGWGDAIFRPAP
jgi:hypothetical protein